jgi:hypothetical protein
MASNQEIAEEIAANLRKGAQLHNYRIGVKFQDGTAWLKGHVSSPEQVKEVVRVVSTTPGVDRVVNKLEIDPAASKELSDVDDSRETTITLKIPCSSMAPEKLSATVNGKRVVARRYSGKVSKPARRLQEVIDTKSERLARANRVPSSYTPRPVQTVSAHEEQLQRAPQPMMQQPRMVQQQVMRSNRPIPVAYSQPCPPRAMPAYGQSQGYGGAAMPMGSAMPMGGGSGITPARYDQPCMPNYAWPSYAAHPNYAAVTYPRQYSPTCWPYIGPFYPYPQVPLGWRKVTLEWDDGWWMLDFKDTCHDTCR